MCSYFQQKIRLLTSVVVGIETFTVKKKQNRQYNNAKALHGEMEKNMNYYPV